jgi:eukaryotic-like serine/threonine-protein kinase
VGPSEPILCPHCKRSNPPRSVRCAHCGALFSDGDETMVTQGAGAGWSKAMTGGISYSAPQSLAPGDVIGERYEILEQLGQGGMGTVYKARDRELDRIVAVKVIRPDLAGDPRILQRFKQELILARQITHKNVIRIFDLGSDGNLKFITMEFVQGRDLGSLLDEKSFPVDEGLRIIWQICRALDAAHAESVIHRDLKPQNVLIDARGKVCVMDFGLARSIEMHGLTQTGAVIGTPAYMSPEQAKGLPLDARSDLFALGIIAYEILTGKVPFKADTVLASLLKRTQEPPEPPNKVNPGIPQEANDVVMKCLAIDPAQRYQTAAEILADLDILVGDRTITGLRTTAAGFTPSVPRAPAAPKPLRRWIVLGAAALVIALLVAGIAFRGRFLAKPPTKAKTVTILVSDFKNSTGDPIFDGTLEPMLTFALEGASFISAYNRTQARQLAGKLRPGSTSLDESVSRLIAVREGLNVVVSCSLARQGEGYSISIQAVDAVTGKTLASSNAKAANRDGVLSIMPKLASPIREALGDSTPASARLQAAETFTSASLEAAHQYSTGQDLMLMGKYKDAIDAYSHAIQLDSNFGRSYSGLGVAYRNLGQMEEAEKYMKLALVHINQMTDREKYRTRGAYYVTIGSYDKAVEEYSALVKQYPADTAGHANLGVAYFHLRNLPRAIEEARKAVEIYPKNVGQRSNVALYTLYSGDFEGAAREVRAVLDSSPSFERSYFVMAASELAQSRNSQAADWYHKLEAVSTWGASYAAMGLADLALYEGRTSDAIDILNRSIAGDLAGNSVAGARKSLLMADAYLAADQPARALAAADHALQLDRADDRLLAAALVFVRAGQEAKARSIAAEFQKKLEAGAQANAKIIGGETALKHANPREAIKQLEEAQKLVDTWMGRFALGRAYLEAGAFTEADSELDRCMKRKGEIAAVFLDDIPTYRYFPPLYYYLGRAREGLKSPGAAESYRAFLAIKEKGQADALVTDARRRLNTIAK